VSLGYLSEVERGRKEASSELLAAICDALGLPLPDLLDEAAMMLRPITIRQVPIGNSHADLRLAEMQRVPTPAGPRVADAA
jgi:transcriptional regulator with XRE-family HTH domain